MNQGDKNPVLAALNAASPVHWVIVALSAVVMIGAVVAFYLSFSQKNTNRPEGFPQLNLLRDNHEYRLADGLLESRPEEAVALYQDALQEARGVNEEAQIKFRLALATTLSNGAGNYLAAIPLFKEIASNDQYSKVIRAQAVEEMGLMFSRNADIAITDELFSSEPYSNFFDETDVEESYLKVFEYASSLYPLAVSELKIADSYAKRAYRTAEKLAALADIPTKDVLTRSGQSAISDAGERANIDVLSDIAFIQSAQKIIQDKIANADIDIVRIQNIPNEAEQMPTILQRKAVIVGRMTLLGDDSWGNAEELYQQLLNLYAAKDSQRNDGYARYYYASFLTRMYGVERYADVQAILSPFYTTDRYAGSPVERFFKNEKLNTLKVKESLVELAEADPKFKEYLILLDWRDEDFK